MRSPVLQRFRETSVSGRYRPNPPFFFHSEKRIFLGSNVLSPLIVHSIGWEGSPWRYTRVFGEGHCEWQGGSREWSVEFPVFFSSPLRRQEKFQYLRTLDTMKQKNGPQLPRSNYKRGQMRHKNFHSFKCYILGSVGRARGVDFKVLLFCIAPNFRTEIKIKQKTWQEKCRNLDFWS